MRRSAEVTAEVVLVAAPIVAFQAVDTPGILTLGFSLPFIYLSCEFARSPGARLPVWSLVLIALLALSVLWGDDPAYSVERLRTYLPLALSVCVAGALLSSREILRSLRISFGIIMALSLLALVRDPSTRTYESQLVLHAQFDKNTYGGLLGIALVLTIVRPRRINLLLVPGLLVLILFDRSVTVWAITALLVFVVVLGRLTFGRLGPRAGRVPFAAALVGSLVLAAAVYQATSTALLALVGKDPGLSERTAIWAACWPEILRSPVLGHGAYTFLDAASNSPVTQTIWLRFSQYLPPHPHSGLLDLWGQIGIVGVVAYVGLVISAMRHAARGARAGSEAALTALLGVGFVVLFGFTEPAYLGSWGVLTFAFAAMADRSAREHEPDLEHSGPVSAVRPVSAVVRG